MSVTRAILFILLVIFFTFANNVRANDSREIRNAEKLLAMGDYDNAFEKYQRLALE